jgi:hypothetical protein
MWDFRFSRLRVRRLEPSGIQSHVVSEYTDVSSPWWLILYAPLKRRSTPRLRRYIPEGSNLQVSSRLPVSIWSAFGIFLRHSFCTQYKVFVTFGKLRENNALCPDEWMGGGTVWRAEASLSPDDPARLLSRALDSATWSQGRGNSRSHRGLCWRSNAADLCNAEPLSFVLSLQAAECSVIAGKLLHRPFALWLWNGSRWRFSEHCPHNTARTNVPHSGPRCSSLCT